jgi:TIR domain
VRFLAEQAARADSLRSPLSGETFCGSGLKSIGADKKIGVLMEDIEVFISYVRDNKRDVDRLVADLKAHGIDTWIDRTKIYPGMDWKQAIRRAISGGAYFLACYSREYVKKDETFMNAEIGMAIDRLQSLPFDRMWFIPVRLNECTIPEISIGRTQTLRDLHYADLFPDWDAGIRHILKTIGRTQVPDNLLSVMLYGDYITQLNNRGLGAESIVQLINAIQGLQGLPGSWQARYLALYLDDRDLRSCLQRIEQETEPEIYQLILLGIFFRSMLNVARRIDGVSQWELEQNISQLRELLEKTGAPPVVGDRLDPVLAELRGRPPRDRARILVTKIEQLLMEDVFPWLKA